MKVFCSLIVVFTLFLGEAYGKEEQISFRFQLLCLERTLDELKYTASGEVINVEVPKASFSKIYQYTGNPKIDFFVERLEGDQTRRILVQTLNIPIKAYSSMLRLNPDNTVFLFVQTDERDDRLLKVYSVSYRDPDASGSKASKSAEPSKKRTVNKQTLSDREKSIYNLEQGADLDP